MNRFSNNDTVSENFRPDSGTARSLRFTFYLVENDSKNQK